MSIYLLSESSYEGVINLPVIHSVYFDDTIDVTHYDALIFSSKNAVIAINKINILWKHIPSFAIGTPTAEVIRNLGGKVAYVSKSSYGNNFAKELLPMFKNKKVLFLRAQKVLSNLESILINNNIDLTSKVIYKTTCSSEMSDQSIKKNSAIIFTSPSTVKCFFKIFKWDKSNTAICIGDITLAALPQNIDSIVSKIQTIDACIDLAKTVIKQN